MEDFSSLTRTRTHAPLQWKHGVLTIGPPGKSAFPSRQQCVPAGTIMLFHVPEPWSWLTHIGPPMGLLDLG